MYLNIDIDSTIKPFLDDLADKGHAVKEDLYPFIDEFIDTKVTDIVLNIGSQFSAVRSKYWDSYYEKYHQTVENGYPVDYKEFFRGYYAVNEKYGLEPFGIWIERCKEVGIRPWLSFRMNDCHDPKEKTSPLRSSFFYYAREHGMMNGEQYGHYQNSLNYKFPEVREKMLGYINEQLWNYDVHGIELDFMRDLVCFDYVEKDKDICVPVMNDFMREIKRCVAVRENAVGHKIKIMVRVTRDIPKSLRFGFDTRTWVKEKLVDVLVPSPRFHGSDSAIPVDEWKRELPGIEILPCLEGLISTDYIGAHNGVARLTAEMARGHAAAYLTAGADGIYTYNMFGQTFANDREAAVRDKEVQKTLGTYEEITSLPMRFIVVDEDNDIVPAGFERWQQLPVIPDDEGKCIVFKTGYLPADKSATLILGFIEGSADDVEVTLNGKEICGFKPCDTPKPESAMVKGTLCCKTEVSLKEKEQKLVFKAAEGRAVITWVELDVR